MGFSDCLMVHATTLLLIQQKRDQHLKKAEVPKWKIATIYIQRRLLIQITPEIRHCLQKDMNTIFMFFQKTVLNTVLEQVPDNHHLHLSEWKTDMAML